jgi:hypothetical protein
MKLALATAVLLAWLFASIPAEVSAPNAQDFHKLYGEPTMERFAVRNGITVTVEYGADRAACQILIAPRRLLVEVQSPDPPMSSSGVSGVLQELLPPVTRGKQISSDSTQVDGNTLLTTNYEKVSIRRICSSPSCVSSGENQDLRTLVVFKRDACPRQVE